jgi:hypothetical protein
MTGRTIMTTSTFSSCFGRIWYVQSSENYVCFCSLISFSWRLIVSSNCCAVYGEGVQRCCRFRGKSHESSQIISRREWKLHLSHGSRLCGLLIHLDHDLIRELVLVIIIISFS